MEFLWVKIDLTHHESGHIMHVHGTIGIEWTGLVSLVCAGVIGNCTNDPDHPLLRSYHCYDHIHCYETLLSTRLCYVYSALLSNGLTSPLRHERSSRDQWVHTLAEPDSTQTTFFCASASGRVHQILSHSLQQAWQHRGLIRRQLDKPFGTYMRYIHNMTQ
jgi:hypothetical protein